MNYRNIPDLEGVGLDELYGLEDADSFNWQIWAVVGAVGLGLWYVLRERPAY